MPQSRARATGHPPVDPPPAGASQDADDRLPPRLSATQIALWDDCPRRWAYRYDDAWKLDPLPPPDRVLIGSAVHAALAAAATRLAHGLDADQPTGETLQHYQREAAQQRIVDRGALDDGADYTRRGLALLRALAGDDPRRIVEVERGFVVDPMGAGVQVAGRIDLALRDRAPDGRERIRVLDWKASKRPRTAEHVGVDLQMQVYAVAAADRYRDAAVVSSGVAALGAGEEPVAWLARRRADLWWPRDAVARRAAVVWSESRAAARAGEYPANPSRELCGGCEFRDRCPDTAAPMVYTDGA